VSRILKIAIPVHVRKIFDYLPPPDCDVEKLQPGMRVQVSFARREAIGILVEVVSSSAVPLHKIKSATKIIDNESLFSNDIWQLAVWAAEYYHFPLGEVLFAALPTLLRQGKFPKEEKIKEDVVVALFSPHVLNEEQKNAFHEIQSAMNQFKIFLLAGVTGSGKTEVYLQAIAEFLKNKKQVLVLVPEIGLTPQTIQRFQERFSEKIIALHSGLTEKQRLNAWALAKSGEAKIVIGTRSAIFTPFPDLGLIVIDEEHDLSFKQQEGFRYHARDLAIKRAQQNQIPIVLGSATPSLETLNNVKQNRYHELNLSVRAGAASLPVFQILDIRNLILEEGLSQPLLTEMKMHLEAGNQVMLFLNRRGFAPVLMCHACGWIAMCKRCDARMTYHHRVNQLRCHHCESIKKIPQKCEACNYSELHPIGLGTEKLEMILEKYFPEYSIARLDRDTVKKKGKIEELLDGIQSGKHQILIGTQMLAKGHHFPNVTLVAIIDADGGFFSADFRALERMGQLLLQVAGRAGRVEKPGKVLLQTRQPEHPLLHELLNKNYSFFANTLLKEREQAILPPFIHFVLLRAEAHQNDHVMNFLEQIKNAISKISSGIKILGPIPSPMQKRAGFFRGQLLLQSKQRAVLQNFLRNAVPQIELLSEKKRVRWSLDVDPVEMF